MTDLNTLESAVDRALKYYLKGTERIAVGVSGGLDSMCLLSALCKFYSKSRILCVHVQHGIRGAQALRDAEFVGEFCKNNGIEFLRFDIDVPESAKKNKRSIESEARECRRSIFSSLVSSGKADVIALAHHESDRIESVLMHALRGCGTGGLVGMKEFDGYLFRPLLNVSKSEIHRYARENRISCVVDDTNFDTKYLRNFLRIEVLPLLGSRYDLSSLVTLSRLAEEDERFINSLLEEDAFVVGSDECSVKEDKLATDYALSSRYVIRAAKRAGLKTDLEKKHVDAILDMPKLLNGKTIDLPGGYKCVRDYGRVTIYKEKERVDDVTDFVVGITPFSTGYICVTPQEEKKTDGVLFFDRDKMPNDAIVRFRREGDVFAPYGGGTKKLKKYLIDKKIPGRKRDFLPLVCSGNKVLAICGVEISEEIKIDENTVNPMQIKYKEE